MRILLLNWRDPINPKSGGAEIVTMAHAKGWVKAGHTVTWLSSRFVSSKQNEKINGVNIIRKGNGISTYIFAPLYYLKHKNKFDIVIDEIHGIPYFTPLFCKKPIIAFIHEVAGEIWDYMYPVPVNIVGKIVERYYFNFYKKVTFWTDAESTINDLTKHGIPRKNCVAIACPINNDTLRKPLNKEKNPTYIFVSRLVKMKGVEDVIIALAFIRKEQPTAKLWIVGSGDEKYIASLHTLVDQLHLQGAVTFWGQVPNTTKLHKMAKAHVLLHASVKEGWGLVVVEAASQATPAVVYNVGGLRDIIKQGSCGIVIKKNNAEELAKQAVLLYKNKKLYNKLQKNGLDYAKGLRWEDVINKSLSLLENK